MRDRRRSKLEVIGTDMSLPHSFVGSPKLMANKDFSQGNINDNFNPAESDLMKGINQMNDKYNNNTYHDRQQSNSSYKNIAQQNLSSYNNYNPGRNETNPFTSQNNNFVRNNEGLNNSRMDNSGMDSRMLKHTKSTKKLDRSRNPSKRDLYQEGNIIISRARVIYVYAWKC